MPSSHPGKKAPNPRQQRIGQVFPAFNLEPCRSGHVHMSMMYEDVPDFDLPMTSMTEVTVEGPLHAIEIGGKITDYVQIIMDEFMLIQMKARGLDTPPKQT